ncbi:uncharacterized protein LTR77_010604 [Saxophila tyrrhenica]|uniref:C2H2-type domain-containing protein n=1 Tax=Saxophila tyrrhenica TaxID=1690608 RepID=A0AAV9NWY7_9PEZI|nr:hypothetical protein LTR77_010604 [Saxophila tyrrhenica]
MGSRNRSALDTVLTMLYIEQNHSIEFTRGQLPQQLVHYAEQEGLHIVENDKKSLVAQIQQHMAIKGGMRAVDRRMPDGTPFLHAIGARGRQTQAANNFPQLRTMHEEQVVLGWPVLSRGRESQEASGWAALRKTVANRVAKYEEHLQRDVDNVVAKKRKSVEGAIYSSSPPRKQRAAETKPRKQKQFGEKTCSTCGKTFPNQSKLDIHATSHTQEKPYACPDESCSETFGTETNANNHYRRKHTDLAKTLCPTCGRTFSNKDNMKRHRKSKHPSA